MKILKDESYVDVRTQNIVISEIEILKKVKSPNVIEYLDFFRYDVNRESFMCIVTEYCNVCIHFLLFSLKNLEQNLSLI